jgi:hypothetical protein
MRKVVSDAATRPTAPMIAPVPGPPEPSAAELAALDATDPALPVVAPPADPPSNPDLTEVATAVTLPPPVRAALGVEDTGPQPSAAPSATAGSDDDRA